MDKNIKTAYFAGLIDGEGSIFMKTNGVGRNKRPNIKVGMTCEKTIRALHDFFKVGSIYFKKVPLKDKPQWVWEASNKKAIFVIGKILPYLITKKENAELVLSQRFIKKSEREESLSD